MDQVTAPGSVPSVDPVMPTPRRLTIRDLMIVTVLVALALALGRLAGRWFTGGAVVSLVGGWLAWSEGRRSRRLALRGLGVIYAGLPAAVALTAANRGVPRETGRALAFGMVPAALVVAATLAIVGLLGRRDRTQVIVRLRSHRVAWHKLRSGVIGLVAVGLGLLCVLINALGPNHESSLGTGLLLLGCFYPLILGFGLGWLTAPEPSVVPAEADPSPRARLAPWPLLVAAAGLAVVLTIAHLAGGFFAASLALSFAGGWLAWLVGVRLRRWGLFERVVVGSGILIVLILLLNQHFSANELPFVFLFGVVPAAYGFGLAWLFSRHSPPDHKPTTVPRGLVLFLTFAPLILFWPVPLVILWFLLAGGDIMPRNL